MGMRQQQWPWFAILSRTGREKTTTLLLENSGYQCFLPVSKSRRLWSDRVKELEVPLFPGYLFCRMNPHNRLPVLQTPDRPRCANRVWASGRLDRNRRKDQVGMEAHSIRYAPATLRRRRNRSQLARRSRAGQFDGI